MPRTLLADALRKSRGIAPIYLVQSTPRLVTRLAPTIGVVPLANDLPSRRTLSFLEKPSLALHADALPSKILSLLRLWLFQLKQPVPLFLRGDRRCGHGHWVMHQLYPSIDQGPPLLSPINLRLPPLT